MLLLPREGLEMVIHHNSLSKLSHLDALQQLVEVRLARQDNLQVKGFS